MKYSINDTIKAKCNKRHASSVISENYINYDLIDGTIIDTKMKEKKFSHYVKGIKKTDKINFPYYKVKLINGITRWFNEDNLLRGI